MMRGVRSSRWGHGRSLLLIVALVMVVGIIWGLASALAASPATSPAASSGKVVLKLGWTEEPDNLNVFIGYAGHELRDLGAELRDALRRRR